MFMYVLGIVNINTGLREGFLYGYVYLSILPPLLSDGFLSSLFKKHSSYCKDNDQPCPHS